MVDWARVFVNKAANEMKMNCLKARERKKERMLVDIIKKDLQQARREVMLLPRRRWAATQERVWRRFCTCRFTGGWTRALHRTSLFKHDKRCTQPACSYVSRCLPATVCLSPRPASPKYSGDLTLPCAEVFLYCCCCTVCANKQI